MFLSHLRNQFFRTVNEVCKITQPDRTGMISDTVLVERHTPYMAGALPGTNATCRKSKPEKHFGIQFSLLNFLRQMSP